MSLLAALGGAQIRPNDSLLGRSTSFGNRALPCSIGFFAFFQILGELFILLRELKQTILGNPGVPSNVCPRSDLHRARRKTLL